MNSSPSGSRDRLKSDTPTSPSVMMDMSESVLSGACCSPEEEVSCHSWTGYNVPLLDPANMFCFYLMVSGSHH